jgi:hypothetical protein
MIKPFFSVIPLISSEAGETKGLYLSQSTQRPQR